MGAQSVKIPVELEVKQLQSSINTLQNALDKLDPGSKIYKSVEAGLARVAKKMNSLEVESKKTFTNTSQINQFEKDFGKVGTEIQELANMLSKVSFSDLGNIFSEGDLAGIKTAQEQVDQLKAQLSGIRTEKMKELAATSVDVGEAMKNLGKNTFESLTSETEKRISSLTKEIESLETKLAGFEKKKTTLQGSIGAIKKGTPADNLIPGGQYLDKNGRWKGGKNSGKELLKQRLKELGYDSTTLKAVEETASNNIKTLIEKIKNGQENARKNLEGQLSRTIESQQSLQSERDTKSGQRGTYQSALTKLRGIEVDPAVIGAIDELNAKIAEQEKLISELQAKLVEQSGIQQESAKASNEAAEANENNAKSLQAVAKNSEQAAEAAQMLDNIKYAIKRWFGFNEVINLTKQSVRNMVNNIRELDDVMTQIAIVTDMTQKDLWNQMSAYSSMANQFGVTIKGVYEVSQLYYQQGFGQIFDFFKEI